MAPFPGSHEDEIASWPHTHGADWCGEGLRAEPAGETIRCDGCRFWFRPGYGIDPPDHRGRFRDWWDGAGLCRRRAPRPATELGSRGFWRVTHRDEFCGEAEAVSVRRRDT